MSDKESSTTLLEQAHGPNSRASAGILLLAAQPYAAEVAELLQRKVTPHVVVVASHPLCIEALHQETFELLVLEESIPALDPDAARALYEAAGTAVVLEINFGLMQAERILLAARAALRRRRLDLARARAAARAAMERDLMASLTGLLLESQLALRQAGPDRIPALDRLVGLAEHVCAQLRADDVRPI